MSPRGTTAPDGLSFLLLLLEIFARHQAGIRKRIEALLAEIAALPGEFDAAPERRRANLVGRAMRVVIAAARVLDLLAVGIRLNRDE
jgi:hypothetical protein